MKIKMQSSKAESIMAILNQWDPENRRKEDVDYRAYAIESETIAQNIRSNSKMETIEKAVVDAFFETDLDTEEVRSVANLIMRICTRDRRKK